MLSEYLHLCIQHRGHAEHGTSTLGWRLLLIQLIVWPPLGCFARGATRSGQGHSVVNFSSDRKRAEGKKNPCPFSEEWLALLSGEVGRWRMTDKDATDRLKADDHMKQVQESKWRGGLSMLTKPNWIMMMISKWYPRGATAGPNVVVLSRRRLLSSEGNKASLFGLVKTLLVEAFWVECNY